MKYVFSISTEEKLIPLEPESLKLRRRINVTLGPSSSLESLLLLSLSLNLNILLKQTELNQAHSLAV
jgi:hypothetical protein